MDGVERGRAERIEELRLESLAVLRTSELWE